MDEDLVFWFGVHCSTISRHFHQVLDVMAVKTAPSIKWPERDTLRETMPTAFRKFFKKCTVIIDYTEIFIERPSDLLAHAQVWSNIPPSNFYSTWNHFTYFKMCWTMYV